MDIHSKTLHIFKSFLDDLIKVFPEHKETIILNYSEILSLENLSDDKDKLIEKFLNKIDKLSSKITKRWKYFFRKLFLLDEICFKNMESDGLKKLKIIFGNIYNHLFN